MKKWEYFFAYYDKSIDESTINSIGVDGWELVSTIEMDNMDEIRWIFKREKIEKVTPGEGD